MCAFKVAMGCAFIQNNWIVIDLEGLAKWARWLFVQKLKKVSKYMSRSYRIMSDQICSEKKYKRSTAPPRGDPAFQSRPDTFVVIGIGVGTIDRPSYFMLRRVY